MRWWLAVMAVFRGCIQGGFVVINTAFLTRAELIGGGV